jgi:hypothetical protein
MRAIQIGEVQAQELATGALQYLLSDVRFFGTRCWRPAVGEPPAKLTAGSTRYRPLIEQAAEVLFIMLAASRAAS